MKILLGLLIAGPLLFILNILKAAAFKGHHRKYLTRAAILAVL